MISEAKIRAGLETLSYEQISAELEKNSTVADIEALLELMARSEFLFFKYPNSRKEKKRDDLLADLERDFSEKYDVAMLPKLREVISVLKRTELGYRSLLAMLKKLPSRARSPEIQCSATIELTSRRINFVEGRKRDAIAKSKKLILSDEPEGVLGDGSKFSIDAATAGFVENLGTTLGMFAVENHWIAKDGTIVLPTSIQCTEEELDESAATELLAMSWRRWERVEQRRRYWGGEFVDIPEGKPNANIPREGLIYFEYIPSKDDQFDWIANERLKEHILQNFGELRFETFAHMRVSEISNEVALFPTEFVNLNEVNSAGYLSEVLGINVANDLTKHFGLRIVEWLRGYCTLSEIANMAGGRDRPSEREWIVNFSLGQLEEQLVKVGLSLEAANTFISQTTFNSRSIDLFDCPLLRRSDGSVSLVGPAAIHADAGIVTYSNLGSLGDKFEKKGKRFENTVLNFFKDKGFNPYSIEAVRGREPYQIDVILPWENYLFVFECKNKGLSNNHPTRSYYFRKERDGFVEQVRRQVEGLLRYPDMSLEAGGIDPRDKTIVPCVLYEVPYSEAGTVDGVFIADWSSLSRFFKDRYIRAKRPHDIFEKDRLLHRIPLYSFWSNEKPTPQDLVRQLSDPVQLQIMRSRLAEIESVFIVDQNGFGLTREYRRKAQTLNELAKILGFDARFATKEEKRVTKMVASLNKKFREKKLIAQTRSFREKQKRDPH